MTLIEEIFFLINQPFAEWMTGQLKYELSELQIEKRKTISPV